MRRGAKSAPIGCIVGVKFAILHLAVKPREKERAHDEPHRTERFTCRVHGIAYDNGFIWQVCGTQKPGTSDYAGYTPGLVKYDIKTGRVVEQVDFVTGSADIHDVTINKGQLYGVDAGEHPSWSIDVPEVPAQRIPAAQ